MPAPQPTGAPAVKRLAALLFGLALPLLLLAALDLVLRGTGYGDPAALFVRRSVGTNIVYAANARVGLRYFPDSMFRMPLPEHFPVKKAPDTFRVFVLGESAAMGEELHGFSFARILREKLEAACQDRPIEVVNCAFTAINSWIIREFTRELPRYDPDLFIVYMGHNEIVGPYGPGTVFTALTRRPLVLLRLRLSSLRLARLFGSLRGNDQPTAWRGMAMFAEHRIPPGDPRLDAAVRNFEANLADILSCAGRADIPVLLCRPAVNLRDCAPFASAHRNGLVEEERLRWQKHFDRGCAAQADGRRQEAAAAFQDALAIDDTHAELHFRFARCREALDEPDRAAAHYRSACDLDAARFRLTSSLGAVIETVAAEAVDGRVIPVDIAGSFAGASQSGVPGKDLLYDHVHLTVRGHAEIAAKLFDVLRESGLLAPPSPAPAIGQGECLQRLAYTGWDSARNLEYVVGMMSQPPFPGRFGHVARLTELRDKYLRLNVRRGEDYPDGVYAAYDSALEMDHDDVAIRLRLAAFLVEQGRFDDALVQCRIAAGHAPPSVLFYKTRGRAQLGRNAPAEAAADFKRALQIYPNDAEALSNLGSALLAEGQTDAALRHYLAAAQIDPRYSKAHYNAGNVFYRTGRLAQAARAYTRAIAANPLYAKAHNNLAGLLLQQGRPADAVALYEQAIALDPADPGPHFNLGNAWLGLDRPDEAAAAYRRALALEPGYAKAHNNLGLALLEQDRTEEAIAEFRAELNLQPDYANAHFNLGRALAGQGRSREAIAALERAVDLQPDRVAFRNELERTR